MSHPTFGKLVEDSWVGNGIEDKISSFKHRALEWNRKIFGNIFARKRWILGRIEGIQRAMDSNTTHNLFLLERSLREEYHSILFQEETLWLQKSRVSWLKEGDFNTSFFHLSTIVRRRRNAIDRLKDSNNVWLEGDSVLQSLVHGYFKNIFTNAKVVSPSRVDFQHPTVAQGDHNLLCRIPSNTEIKNTVMAMPPWKAPGPDGLGAIFYQQNWETVAKDVLNVVKQCFVTKKITEHMAETNIVLIPKCDKPVYVRDFRPISLCNVIYKIVSKIIADRIKPMVNKVVGPCQRSFVHGRSTLDNIIITQETIQYINKKG